MASSSGNGEDRSLPRGMACSASLPWWSYGAIAIITSGHPHIFYGHLPDAGWGAAPDREHHATFFLAKDATIGDQGGGSGRMEESLPPKISWRAWDLTP